MLRRILLVLLFALPVPPRAVAVDVEPTREFGKQLLEAATDMGK